MTTWLSDSGANRHIKTYVKDFLDVSGNFTVRSGGSDMLTVGPDFSNFIPDKFGFTNNTESGSTNTTTWYPTDASFQFTHNSDTGVYEITDNNSFWWDTPIIEYYDNYTQGSTERYRYINERSGFNLRTKNMNQSALRIDHYHGGVVVSANYSNMQTLTTNASRWRFQVDGWGHLYQNNHYFNKISVYAVNNIVADFQLFASRDDRLISDRRIKTNIQTINDASALDKLRLLNPCTYEYIDKKTMGPYNVEGFIAQEVKEVLPYAVDQHEASVPNIFQEGSYKIDASGNKVLIINDYDTANLEVDASGNIHPILLYKANGSKVPYITVTKIVSSTSLQLDTTEEAPQDFFVYGQYVKDFNILKKDHIFTVATSALQELDRQLQAEKLKKATLETQVADLRARVNVLKGQ